MKIHISASCFEINVYYLIKFCLGPGRSWGFGSPGFPLPLLSVSPMSLVTLVLVSKKMPARSFSLQGDMRLSDTAG